MNSNVAGGAFMILVAAVLLWAWTTGRLASGIGQVLAAFNAAPGSGSGTSSPTGPGAPPTGSA